MATVSLAAEAGRDILRRIARGELDISGIVVRDAASKKIRYVLRGLENLPRDAGRLSNLSALEPLRAAMSVQQVLQLVTIAQNAAMATSLKRIEARLDAVERRLDGIEQRLERLEIKADLVLAAMRESPGSRLKAANGAAVNALRHDDRGALIEAAKDAETAARDLLAQARHLVRIEIRGVPVALRGPAELSDLTSSAAEGMAAASAMQLALASSDLASRLMHETADTIEKMRKTLREHIADPEFLLRRLTAEMADDAKVIAAGDRLRMDQHWTRGRAVMIEAGLLRADHGGTGFETSAPQMEGIFFEELKHGARR